MDKFKEQQKETRFSEMNKDEFVKISIDVKNTSKTRLVEFLESIIKRLGTQPHFDGGDYYLEEGGSVRYAIIAVDNKGIEKEELKCKVCGRPLEHYAIKETGLCTPCFTSNA